MTQDMYYFAFLGSLNTACTHQDGVVEDYSYIIPPFNIDVRKESAVQLQKEC